MTQTSGSRAGCYVRQREDYRAFIPAPLPPDPPVQMDERMWTLLSKADRTLARLEGATETLPNPDLFVFMYVRKEAVLSSQIEALPLYPERRACRWPTARRLIDLFETVQRHTLSSRKGSTQVLVTGLTRLQRKLLRLLGLSASDYSR